jgi:hypothetical protein
MWKNTEKSILMDRACIDLCAIKIYSYNIMKSTKKKYSIKSRKNKNVKRTRKQNRKKTKRVNSIRRIKRKKIKGSGPDEQDVKDTDAKKQENQDAKKSDIPGNADDTLTIENAKKPDIPGNAKDTLTIENAKKPDLLGNNQNSNIPGLTDTDIQNLNNYSANKDSNLLSSIENSEFMKYLKTKILETFKPNENTEIEKPEKKVQIVFYSSKGKKNSVRKYPYFKVFIQDGNTMQDNMDQVDTFLTNIEDPNISREGMFTRTINIDINDLLKKAESEKNTKK